MRFALVLPCIVALIAVPGCQDKKSAETNSVVADHANNDDLVGDILTDPVIIEDTSGTASTGSNGDSSTVPNPDSSTSSSTEEYCYKASTDVCEIEAAIVRETNKYRLATGASPLQFSVRMSFVARDWSNSQSSLRQISHNGFPSARLEAYIKEFGPKPPSKTFDITGENVAQSRKSGQSNDALGIKIAEQWKASSGHYKNMISKSFTAIGVGIVIINDKTVYATQIFGRDINALPPP